MDANPYLLTYNQREQEGRKNAKRKERNEEDRKKRLS